MTKATSFRTLAVGWLILATGPVVARADDEKPAAPEQTAPGPAGPEQLLKDKGLTKDDRKFLLDEADAIKKYDEAKTAFGAFQKAMTRYAAIAEYDETLQAMQLELTQAQQQAAALQAQIRGASSGAGRMQRLVNAQLAPMRQQAAQSQAMVTQMNAQITAFKAQAPKAEDRKAAPAGLQRARDAYTGVVRELGDLVAPLMAKYHELALDKSVKDALAELRHTTTRNYKLGPSDQLVAASRLVQDLKRATAPPSKPAAKKKSKAKTKGS